MKDNYSYNIQLRCVVCGSEDKFEYNDDKSYIKCMNCGKEYFGGFDELVEYNQDMITEIKEIVKEEINKDLQKEINQIFKGNKYLKFK